MRRPFPRPEAAEHRPSLVLLSPCAGLHGCGHWRELGGSAESPGTSGASQSPANGAQVHPGNDVEGDLDAIESLPLDLQRKVLLMREADAKCQVRKEPDAQDEHHEPCERGVGGPHVSENPDRSQEG